MQLHSQRTHLVGMSMTFFSGTEVTSRAVNELQAKSGHIELKQSTKTSNGTKLQFTENLRIENRRRNDNKTKELRLTVQQSYIKPPMVYLLRRHTSRCYNFSIE